jgi:hypothetical protein
MPDGITASVARCFAHADMSPARGTPKIGNLAFHVGVRSTGRSTG